MADGRQDVSPPLASAEAYPLGSGSAPLDLLRGLCVLLIALGHYRVWTSATGDLSAAGAAAWFSRYGPAMLFLVSGHSLARSYGERFKDGLGAKDLTDYLATRFVSIAPLYAALTVLYGALNFDDFSRRLDIYDLVGNASLLFAIIVPQRPIVPGGWIIGAEIIFSLTFPLLTILRQHKMLILTAALLAAAWSSRALLSAATPQAFEDIYVNPANHLVFFAAGVYLGLKAEAVTRRSGSRDHRVTRATLMTIPLLALSLWLSLIHI